MDLFQIAKGIHQGCILSTVQNMQIYIDRKLNNGCYGLGTGEEWGVTANRNQASLGENENTTLN